jgi:hypothetical protein
MSFQQRGCGIHVVSQLSESDVHAIAKELEDESEPESAEAIRKAIVTPRRPSEWNNPLANSPGYLRTMTSCQRASSISADACVRVRAAEIGRS